MDRYYFDYNATTPLAPEVAAAYLPVLQDVYGNASSIHYFGQAAQGVLEQARGAVAGLLGARPAEIIFTSGGTESNNLALFGILRPATGKHVVTTTVEHPAVLNPCAQLEREGASVTYVPVGSSGVVDPERIRASLRPDTALIAVMHANNELGTIQPIADIGLIARERGIPFHCDGVQAVGKLPVDVATLGVTTYALSAHKLGAVKGVGALYVGKNTVLTPQQWGGRHERQRRAGTENVAGAAALGAACAWWQKNGITERTQLAALRDRFESQLPAGVRVNAAKMSRLPNTSSVLCQGLEGEALVIALDLQGFAISSGAACSSGAVEPSHVLTAIGLSRSDARSCLRISLGRGNTPAQVDALAAALGRAVAHLRRLSPVEVFA